MNKKESNKLNSFQTTEEVMLQNRSVWEKSEKISVLFSSIQDRVYLVRVVDQKKNRTQPSSVLKKEQKAELIALAVKISKSGIDYAAGKNDSVLEFKVKVGKHLLEKLKENTLLTTLQKLYEAILPLRSELIYLAETDIDTFKKLLDTFASLLAKPQAEMSQSKTATETLSSLFMEINDMYITLDKYLGPFEYTHPEFYSNYKNSRVVKDLRKVSKAKAAAKKAAKESKAA